MSDEETVLVRGYLAAIQALCIQVEALISGEGAACEHPPSMLNKRFVNGAEHADFICDCGAAVSVSWEDYEAQIEAFERE